MMRGVAGLFVEIKRHEGYKNEALRGVEGDFSCLNRKLSCLKVV
jgi:hypothetical protein